MFDPYRDITYRMKNKGIVDSSNTNFGEFMWANYFRLNIPFPSKSPMVSWFDF